MPSNPALRASETTAPTSKWATQGYIDCGRQFKRTGKHLPECPLGHADPAVSAPRVPEETPPKNDAIIVSTSYDEVTGRMTFHDPVPAVLPTADAPTAEELIRMVKDVADDLRSDAMVLSENTSYATDVEKRLIEEAKRWHWLASRLSSLIAADADRQRLDAFAQNPDWTLYQTSNGLWHVEYLRGGTIVATVQGDSPRAAIDAAVDTKKVGFYRAARSPEGEP